MMDNTKKILNQDKENLFSSMVIFMLASFKKILFMEMESTSLIKNNLLLEPGIMENYFKIKQLHNYQIIIIWQ